MQELYDSAQQEVYGSLHTAHQWVNMTDVTVPINSTHSVSNLRITRFTLVLTLVLVKNKSEDRKLHRLDQQIHNIGYSLA